MKTLEDVLTVLDSMNVGPDEVKISRAAYNYLIGKVEELIAAEEEEEDED